MNWPIHITIFWVMIPYTLVEVLGPTHRTTRHNCSPCRPPLQWLYTVHLESKQSMSYCWSGPAVSWRMFHSATPTPATAQGQHNPEQPSPQYCSVLRMICTGLRYWNRHIKRENMFTKKSWHMTNSFYTVEEYYCYK
jgi:hypothetical protein